MLVGRLANALLVVLLYHLPIEGESSLAHDMYVEIG